MSKLVHCFILLTIYTVFCEGVWPLPTWMQKGDSTLYIDPSSFTVHANITSPLLHNAVNRYLETLFFPFNRTNDIPPNAETLLDLYIQVGDLSEDLQLGIDESYSMYLQEEHSYQAFLTANTIWGAMRGLETFSQLINFDYDNRVYLINQVPFEISDQPRYPWRGLLIDTSRHYLEPRAILRTIDAMSWNKFNTLHWHIIDAEAFPFVVTSFPLLSKDGAYSRHSIYPPAFVNYVVNFAKERGIRVVIEVDMPGHSYSWGKGYPNITAVCPLFETQKDQIALNPTIPFTYDVIHGILEQIETSTIDDCVHLGGDEVQYDCWLDDPSIALWMLENNKTATETADMFYATVASQAAMLKKRTLYWEDIFGYSVLPDSIFEVYSGISQLKNIIRNKGYVINSYGWYLDMQSPLPYETYEWVDTWRVMWSFDPAESANLTKIQERYFLGGEALMWGDQVDSTNIDSRVWPRASAVAERLWTPAIVKDVYAALSRLVDFRCRMARRGIGAGPVNPDFCPLPFDENHDFPGFDQ